MWWAALREVMVLVNIFLSEEHERLQAELSPLLLCPSCVRLGVAAGGEGRDASLLLVPGSFSMAELALEERGAVFVCSISLSRCPASLSFVMLALIGTQCEVCRSLINTQDVEDFLGPSGSLFSLGVSSPTTSLTSSSRSLCRCSGERASCPAERAPRGARRASGAAGGREAGAGGASKIRRGEHSPAAVRDHILVHVLRCRHCLFADDCYCLRFARRMARDQDRKWPLGCGVWLSGGHLFEEDQPQVLCALNREFAAEDQREDPHLRLCAFSLAVPTIHSASLFSMCRGVDSPLSR